MLKGLITTLILLVLILGGIFAYHEYLGYQAANARKAGGPPLVSVSVVKVKTISYQPTISAIGSLEALQGTDILPQVGGRNVTGIHFQSGQLVKAGDLLVTLRNDDLYAQLVIDQAALKLAAVTYQRNLKLFKQQAIAREDLDTYYSTMKQAEGKVLLDEANINNTYIKAPFSGRVGIRLVNLGQAVSTSTVVTNIQELDPILINFSIPQNNYSALYVGQDVQLTLDAYPGETFHSKIIAINAEVDSDNRSVLVQSQAANPDLKLQPGMFVNVNVLTKNKENVLVVPQTCVSYTLYGNIIYEIGQKTVNGKTVTVANSKTVTLGARVGDQVIVTSGLKEGDLVVNYGQLNLNNGTLVKVVSGTASTTSTTSSATNSTANKTNSSATQGNSQ